MLKKLKTKLQNLSASKLIYSSFTRTGVVDMSNYGP